ncbi:hypothetical protein Nepgr_025967 [Nepenthes gracilis]|uniref:Acidic leucine-rich nuclear phosphoprotein 32-related protein n=1 Tax=Nepenthes gracilis TaxID=150966 RepID=A0AAD3T803_NEPGR|nr:hypothetical protein Nepgr_025967 [Nepenthes gracilis]
MDEIWERAVETALDGQTDFASVRTLTLDGAVKCVHGRLPTPNLLEQFENLQHLSIANIGVSSLVQFPRLPNLQKLILSDNRIASGLECIVEAGLDSLRDLDLSNNRIQYIEDLAPLAQLRLVSLDLYECPVTRVKDYRARVFGLIKSLKYLDKMDAEENERPESDEEDDDDDEDDPGSGEVDGEDRPYRINDGPSGGRDGIVDVDEDEESEADEEETETSSRKENGIHGLSNGFRVAAAGEVGDEEDEEDGEDEEENESVEEIDEDDGEDEDVVEVHEIEESGDEDGVEYDEDEDYEDEVEEVDNEDGDLAEPTRTRLMSTEGEIDGHEHGEDEDDEDVDGVTGEEEQGVEDEGEYEDEDDGEEEEEDCGAGYLVQPVGRAVNDAEGSDMEPGNEEDDGQDGIDDDDEENVDNLGEVQVASQPSFEPSKRKRDCDEENEEEECRWSSRHHRKSNTAVNPGEPQVMQPSGHPKRKRFGSGDDEDEDEDDSGSSKRHK